MLKLTPPLLTVAFWSVHRLIATNRCVFAVPLARVQSTSTLGVSFAPPKSRGGVAFVLPPPCVSSACLGVGFVLVVFVVTPWHEVYMLGTGIAMLAAGESANSYALKRPEAHALKHTKLPVAVPPERCLSLRNTWLPPWP